MSKLVLVFIEVSFSIGMIVNAFLFFPQIVRLAKTKSAKSFSLITFAGFNLIQFFTVLHAYLHRDYLLFFLHL